MKVSRNTSNVAQTQLVSLDSSKVNSSPDIDILFKPLPYNTTPSTKGRSSSFSVLMAKTKNVKNPFVQYGQFDAQKSSQTIKLRVTLTMAQNPEDTIDMNVVSRATVDQAIGLILFQYCTEGRQPQLSGTVDDYCLRHLQSDDDDDDILMFQPLTPRDLIKKYYSYHFGFGALELALYKEDKDEKIIVKINFEDKTHTTFHFRNMKVKMEEIFIRAVKKRIQYRTGLPVYNEVSIQREEKTLMRDRSKYVIEKQNTPGENVNLESFLEDMKTLEFRLLRTYSKRTSQVELEADNVRGYSRFESLNYEVFSVQVESRVIKKKIDVQLGISGEKIEIDPLTKSPLPPFKLRAETIPCINLISSEKLVDYFSSDRLKLKIIYLNDNKDPKEYIFEAPFKGDHIHRKITFIINQLQSKVRRDYFLYRKYSQSSSNSKLSSFLSSPFGSSSPK